MSFFRGKDIVINLLELFFAFYKMYLKYIFKGEHDVNYRTFKTDQ